jgi:hypothetical protein
MVGGLILGSIELGPTHSLSDSFSSPAKPDDEGKSEKPAAGLSLSDDSDADERPDNEIFPLPDMGPRYDLITGKIDVGPEGSFNPHITLCGPFVPKTP